MGVNLQLVKRGYHELSNASEIKRTCRPAYAYQGIVSEKKSSKGESKIKV